MPKQGKDQGKNAAIYVRISDARDGDEAGIKRQEQDCRKLAKSLGLTVFDVYPDNNVSAYKRPFEKREHGARLLEDLRAGLVDTVIVYSLDRLYRRLADLQTLTDALKDVPVHTVKSGDLNLATADGRMQANVTGAVAQHEVEKRGERVARAAQQRAEEGRFGGGRRRFGYNKTATELIPEEADAIREAYRTIAAGGTLESVVREWKKTFGVGSLGGKITGVQVRDTLLRPLNAGLSYYKGQAVGPSKSPAIVDADLWWTVRGILTDPKRRTTVGRPATSLLAPLLRCGVCDGRMSAKNRFRKRKGDAAPEKDPIYICREGHVSRHRTYLDEALSELAVAYLEKQASKIKRPSKQVSSSVGDEADRLRQQLDSLATLFSTGELEAADYAKATRLARERLEKLEEQMAKQSGKAAARALVTEGDIRKAWEGMSVDARRSVLKEIIDRITVHPARPGPFTMDGVEIKWATA